MIIRDITTHFEDSPLHFVSFGMTGIFSIRKEVERGDKATSLHSIYRHIGLSFRPKGGISQK